MPKSLEGFFIYEEEGSGVPGAPRRGHDAIVVEQWTVIEVSHEGTLWVWDPACSTLAHTRSGLDLPW